jgi:hypothetical protein
LVRNRVLFSDVAKFLLHHQAHHRQAGLSQQMADAVLQHADHRQDHWMLGFSSVEGLPIMARRGSGSRRSGKAGLPADTQKPKFNAGFFGIRGPGNEIWQCPTELE